MRRVAGDDDALGEDEMECIERLFKVCDDVTCDVWRLTCGV